MVFFWQETEHTWVRGRNDNHNDRIIASWVSMMAPTALDEETKLKRRSYWLDLSVLVFMDAHEKDHPYNKPHVQKPREQPTFIEILTQIHL